MGVKLLRKPIIVLLAITITVGVLAVGIAISASGLNPEKSKIAANLNPVLLRSSPQETPQAIISTVPENTPQALAALVIPPASSPALVGSSELQPTPSPTSLAETITKLAAGERIEFAQGRLINNDWGAPKDEDLKSGIFLSPDNSFGWFWERHKPKEKPGIKGVLPIYPGIRVGGSPWDSSNSTKFPIRLGDIQSLKFSLVYKYSQIPDGSYDFAYDMFLSDTDQPSANPKRDAEIMIWIHQTINPPPGNYQGDYSDGTNTYGLYSYIMSDGRLYYAFVMKGQPVFAAQNTVDVKKLLEVLKLNPNWYLPGVDLGNEVIAGSGSIEISQLEITLNGQNV